MKKQAPFSQSEEARTFSVKLLAEKLHRVITSEKTSEKSQNPCRKNFRKCESEK